MPEIVFDGLFRGSEGEASIVLVLVARDCRAPMLFAHIVRRKGIAHRHVAREFEQDINRLGYCEVLRKCKGGHGINVSKQKYEYQGKSPRCSRTPLLVTVAPTVPRRRRYRRSICRCGWSNVVLDPAWLRRSEASIPHVLVDRACGGLGVQPQLRHAQVRAGTHTDHQGRGTHGS